MLIQVVGPVQLQHLPEPCATLALSERQRGIGRMIPNLPWLHGGGSRSSHRYVELRLESLLRLSWRVRFMDGGRFPGVSMN